tara:strand:+ start:10017 stop:10265 length:249 start_codon:yes stop_codon:yes gene_type:complete
MTTDNQTQPQELNQSQALNVLIQAVRIAQGKGAYTLEDAEMVSKAIKVFVPPTPETEEGAEDPVINKDEDAEATEPVVEKVK